MNGIEKRKYPRYEVKFLVKYKEADDSKPKWNVSQVKNLSLGGLAFISAEKYSQETTLVLKLQLPHAGLESAKNEILTLAKVKHVHEKHLGADSYIYFTGVAFVEVDESNKSQIQAHISSLPNKS